MVLKKMRLRLLHCIISKKTKRKILSENPLLSIHYFIKSNKGKCCIKRMYTTRLSKKMTASFFLDLHFDNSMIFNKLTSY